MDYRTQSGQVALLTTVLHDPVGSLTEVQHALLQIVTPRPLRRPVVVEGYLFESVTDAAFWLHYRTQQVWVKAELVKLPDSFQCIKNIIALIRNRCNAYAGLRTGQVLPNWYWAPDGEPRTWPNATLYLPGSSSNCYRHNGVFVQDWRWIGRANREEYQG